MIRYFLVVFALSYNIFAQTSQDSNSGKISIIPEPQSITYQDGQLTLESPILIHTDKELELAESFLNNYLEHSKFELKKSSKTNANLFITLDKSLPKDGYSIGISKNGIHLKASDSGGALYAVQTLRQLLPPSLEQNSETLMGSLTLPLLHIEDAPKFSYRGMHLDVGRHFFDIAFLKKYIGYLSMLKMNYFHWHLTEDQGWRIEIKKHPKLTSHAAYREETLVGHYNDNPQQYDGQRYGGFYTQEEIKEIVAYAESLNITVIPEIEMPGHAQAAISAYPDLGCSGEPVAVATKWGVFEEVFCPKEATFTFLEEVLSEVIELFPGPYIHIGGDEAPKMHWKNCQHCQQLIQKEGLKDEHELQSYFIKRIESFVNAKGKKIIGWDEILEGGLAPNATVMSWRGTQGGIDAAEQNHPVIMTPTSHCYFDYYQSENASEPLAIGGFLPLKKVFYFDPVPESLDQDKSKYILGAQGNVWTEYMKNPDHVEYMIFPRMMALSEVVWHGPASKTEAAYSRFTQKVEQFYPRLDAMGVHYANHLYEIESSISKKKGTVYYELATPTPGKEIRYTMNHEPSKTYQEPIPLNQHSVIKSQLYKNKTPIGTAFIDTIIYHKAITGRILLNEYPHPSYAAGGKEALINGKMGSSTRYGDREWLGFWGKDLEIIIDLNQATEVNGLNLRFFNAPGQWIYAPKEVHLKIDLSDGQVVFVSAKAADASAKIQEFSFNLDSATKKVSTQRIILEIPNYGLIPDGKQGAGNKAWTFVDEIIVK